MRDESTNKPYGFVIRKKPNSKTEWLCEFYITPPPLRVLSFKGGAGRTFVYRAVLEYMEKKGLLKQIEEVGGSSSGCIAAVFTCIPFKDSSSRIRAMDAVADSYPWDVMKDTPGWNWYQTLTKPFHYVSKVVEWLSLEIEQLAKTLNTYVGKIARYPFQFVSQLFYTLALAISPRTYAGLYNILTEGGVYHGEISQAAFCKQIQASVQDGLIALLDKQENKESIIKHLQSIGLCNDIEGKLQVTADVTFSHLYELSKIPGSQFKQCYLSSAKIKDKQLIVFNKDNTPHLPIHFACRIVSSFPVLFTDKTYLGDKYFDGGTINNSPVDLATNKTLPDLYEIHKVTDKLARLNIRVEYPNEYENHLWRKEPEKTVFEKFYDYVLQSILIFLMKGVDAYANDKTITLTMQNDYPQRTLQLKDFNISRFSSEVTNEMRDELCEQLIPDIEDYFDNHANEQFILTYEISNESCKPSNMPSDLQTELLAFLRDEKNRTKDLFDIQENKIEEISNIEELENFRIKLIHSLSDMSLTSNALILKKIGESKICERKCQNEVDCFKGLIRDELGVKSFDKGFTIEKPVYQKT